MSELDRVSYSYIMMKLSMNTGIGQPGECLRDRDVPRVSTVLEVCDEHGAGRDHWDPVS
jgi:hypothetical protein